MARVLSFLIERLVFYLTFIRETLVLSLIPSTPLVLMTKLYNIIFHLETLSGKTWIYKIINLINIVDDDDDVG